jgi:hypothetical protein
MGQLETAADLLKHDIDSEGKASRASASHTVLVRFELETYCVLSYFIENYIIVSRLLVA